MKRRNILLILNTILLICLTTCKKDPNYWLTETGSSSIDSARVTFNGSIVMEGDQDGSEYGICYSLTTTNPTLVDSFKNVGQAKELGEYSSTLQLLPPGKYSYCSYLKGKEKTQYGEVKTITVVPYAYLKNLPGKLEPEADTIKIVLSNNLPLTATSNTLWVRLASNTIKTGYLQTIELMVDSNTTQTDRSANVLLTAEGINQNISISQKLLIVLPTVTTSVISAITATTASCGGNITFNGGADIQERGVCWSTSMNPTLENDKTSDGFSSGEYSSYLTGLTENTTYYVRAYTGNSKGIAYGQQKVFTTTAITKPVITTLAATEIEYTSATIGGNVTYDGGAAVTDKGVCWNTSGNPTVSDNKLSAGKGSGDFASKLTGLQENTTYYIRAFAINNKGTSYGEQQTFTTKEITVPILTTKAASNISYTSATSGGNITSDGGATITTRGVCWNITGNPTITDNKTSDGNGTGAFTSNLSSLTDGTKYYVRAYATNSKGTSYGAEQTLTTSAITTPIITTTAISNISYTSATSGGNITSDGGASVTARGVCWNTTGIPTITDNKTSDGAGSGTFTSNLFGLKESTTYYIRAYALNHKGIIYGQEISLSIPDAPLKDIDGNIYNIVTIGTQTWMADNLRTTKYNDGASIPNVIDNTSWAAQSTPAYCWYNNDSAIYANPYGALYNWYAVNTGKLCPLGWHVPSNIEWTILMNYIGGENVAGGKLKEKGTTHWNSQNTGTDDYGFKGIPGAYRTNSFAAWGFDAEWWSSSVSNFGMWQILSYSNSLDNHVSENYIGASVRCVRDK